MSARSLRHIAAVYAPLALHVIPTLVIGFLFVIPQSCIAGVNELTIGFLAAIIGFVPSYVAGVKLAQKRAEAAHA